MAHSTLEILGIISGAYSSFVSLVSLLGLLLPSIFFALCFDPRFYGDCEGRSESHTLSSPPESDYWVRFQLCRLLILIFLCATLVKSNPLYKISSLPFLWELLQLFNLSMVVACRFTSTLASSLVLVGREAFEEWGYHQGFHRVWGFLPWLCYITLQSFYW